LAKTLYACVVLIIITSILLVACQAATTSVVDCNSAEVFCVGLVTGLGGIDDRAFNQSAWEGIQAAQNENIADKVSYIETIDAKDYNQNIISLAQAGYDVIVTVGEQYSTATASIAKQFPGIFFIGVDQAQDEILHNLSGLVFQADYAGFLAGVLAAQITKTNIIAGVFDESELPSSVALKEGYEAGASYINPDIKIISTYYPLTKELAVSDPRWGANTATAALQDGADVLFSAGVRTGTGALIAAANQIDAYCIGIGSDQWETLPDARNCLVSSAVKMINQGVFDEIKLARDGKFPSGNHFGKTELAPFHEFDTIVSPEVKDEIFRITAGLAEGEISTGYSPGK
jgi:basic membrane protein A